MFKADSNRFATFGVISKLPGAIIDQVWYVIDENLQGVFPLESLLRFDVLNNSGRVQLYFSEDNLDTQIAFDTQFEFKHSYPETLYAYDDGKAQTILLPEEANK